MEAPLHRFPIPPPPLPLPQDALLLQQHAVSARTLMMEAAGAGNNKAPPLAAGPGREQCPRCASRDTKFCYFNNYNTAQPRHFCRACRRYWTLGGSLRNVPVGGSTRKRTRRPVMRPTRAMAAAVAAAMATPTATASAGGGSPFAASPQTMLLQGAGREGLLLSSLLLGSASASASPLLAFGAAPLLEGRLGFSDLGLGAADAAAGDLAHHHTLPLGAGPLPWPASTILEGEGDNGAETTTTWKAASSVFPYPPAAALWQELAAAAPAVGTGELRHGAASHLLL